MAPVFGSMVSSRNISTEDFLQIAVFSFTAYSKRSLFCDIYPEKLELFSLRNLSPFSAIVCSCLNWRLAWKSNYTFFSCLSWCLTPVLRMDFGVFLEDTLLKMSVLELVDLSWDSFSKSENLGGSLLELLDLLNENLELKRRFLSLDLLVEEDCLWVIKFLQMLEELVQEGVFSSSILLPACCFTGQTLFGFGFQ